jgi:ABC-type nickel/cobalt efflux system permease component RcnA
LTLGISGGIVPCPAALVVLLSAVALNRVGFGLLLIVSFSAGLAAVLIAVGLLMVYARQFMSRFYGEGKWVTRWLPMTSSVFIVVVGIGLTWQAWRGAAFSLL